MKKFKKECQLLYSNSFIRQVFIHKNPTITIYDHIAKKISFDCTPCSLKLIKNYSLYDQSNPELLFNLKDEIRDSYFLVAGECSKMSAESTQKICPVEFPP